MMNKDEIQLKDVDDVAADSCGLVMNKDEIQQTDIVEYLLRVVVW